jgi:hypothetical protein
MSDMTMTEETGYGLAEAGVLSGRYLSAATLPDALARPAVTDAITWERTPAARVVVRKEGSQYHVEIHGKEPAWTGFGKSAREVVDLLKLKPGWNSYSAKPVDPGNVKQAIEILARFPEAGSPSPAVVPTVRGGIQLEWHASGINLEIYIESPDEISFFAEEAGTAHSDELSVNGHEEVLAQWMHHLSRK